MQKKYVIMTDTIIDGTIISHWTSDGKPGSSDTPLLFDTEEDAWKEIADDMIEGLRQFIKGERDLEDTQFSTEEWVEPVAVTDSGMIFHYWPDEPGKILFNPKKGRQ